MQDYPLISIIVPIYKVEEYLRPCIDSLLAQTYTNLEIILVDDGSPDDCGKICDEYAQKDLRVNVIHKENGGLSDARNAGLNICKGEFISFVDSDDLVAPEFIEVLYENIQRKSDIDISIVYFKKFWKEDEVFDISKNLIGNVKIIDKYEMFREFYNPTLLPNNIVAWNKLYKRKLWDSLRYPKGKIHEDEFIIHHLYHICSSITINIVPYYYYRERENSIMVTFNEQKINNIIEAFNDRIAFAKENGYEEFYRKTQKQLSSAIFSLFYKNKNEVTTSYVRNNFLRIFLDLKVRTKIRFLFEMTKTLF